MIRILNPPPTHMIRSALVVLMTFGFYPTLTGAEENRIRDGRSLQEAPRAAIAVLNTFCLSCHDSEPDGGFSISELDRNPAGGPHLESWRLIYERVKFREMPPADAVQPGIEQRRILLDWIRTEQLKLHRPGASRQTLPEEPRYGNYVDHTALFDEPAGSVIPGSPRVWRLRPKIYEEVFAADLRARHRRSLTGPFMQERGGGFQDYASRGFIDEPATEQLLANAEIIVRLKFGELLESLVCRQESPPTHAVDAAIHRAFELILHRPPSRAESARFALFHGTQLRHCSQQLAAEQLLLAICLQPEAVFREELGEGQPDEHGRIRLKQREIAFAISYALGNQPDSQLLAAAQTNALKTRDEVVAQIRRRMTAPYAGNANPRIRQFFREYFDYGRATEIFKAPPPQGSHLPDMLVNDLDLLIEDIVERDHNVLRELLTTGSYFIDCRKDPDSGLLSQYTSQREKDITQTLNPEHATIYGLPRDWIWTDQQPVALPSDIRSGVLMHPAWLVAWSGNFNNHPVQRGRWIRTHLLGGTVPDVPIDVSAVVPEDATKQFGERLLLATAGARCQRCHRKMDPLGLPFERYDHYGRCRILEVGRPINTLSAVTHVEDSPLAGSVADAREMMSRLADSDHVEQVFIRHVFRYFMGRNETLGDAKTLQDMHLAWHTNSGSFRKLLETLLTSESFLYRLAESPSD